jgi:CxxC-x17-CxxC domain-containing protein
VGETSVNLELGEFDHRRVHTKGETMSYQERKMYDVSHMGLRCAECAAEIRELPFQPRDDRPVYCKDCARKRRPPRSGGGGPRR